MTDPTYEDYYPARPATGLTEAEQAEYDAIFSTMNINKENNA